MYVREYLGFTASLYKMGKSSAGALNNVISMTGLGPEQNKKIGALSKGYRQRVGLAQALIHNPGILILDEATSGLDPNQIAGIRNLIREAGKEKTILLSTHIMQEVEAICDRIIIVDKGKIVADETKENIYSIISHPHQVVTVEFDKSADESAILSIQGVARASSKGGLQWIIEAEGSADIRPAVFSFAVARGLTVLSLQQEESNLEEIFRSLTAG
jgi:ABC-2 type transport system ATP-binding protein